MEDINMAVSMGKFEKVPDNAFHGNILPEGYNGVNVFAVPELRVRGFPFYFESITKSRQGTHQCDPETSYHTNGRMQLPAGTAPIGRGQ